MNVASPELCKELYDLSGWTNTVYWKYPAYDLGYLLRKLPNRIKHHYPNNLEIMKEDDEKYWASYSDEDDDIFSECGDTPEDAACKLAVELFKSDIITREDRDQT